MGSGAGDLERRLGVSGLGETLERYCLDGPPRADALQRAVALLEAAEPERMRRVWPESGEHLARVAGTLASAAPFLIRHLARHPDWMFALAEEDLAVARSAEEYVRRLDAALEGAAPDDERDALRRFKYYELARLSLREASGDIVPEEQVGETLAELSHLADALLARAARQVARRLPAPPERARWKTADGSEVSLRFAILGLGKLGAEELNYSSDVDLVYVFESPPGPLEGGPEGLAPEDYFTRWAKEFGRWVADVTSEGFLYRVDLDLRPEGKLGPPVIGSGAFLAYYDAWAAAWEKAAFMKARPVAGDLAFGWTLVRELDPILYRTSMDVSGVAAIREMKERVEQESDRSPGGFDVKRDSGGIRDVEFVAQALQLLHGGRIPQLRGRSTQRALASLAGAGVLSAERVESLLAAYRFLRRVENRLQMEDERQVHRVPEREPARDRLARSLGFRGSDALTAFDSTLAEHRARAREAFEDLLPASADERVIALFAQDAHKLMSMPSTRGMMEQLAHRFAQELENSANPELALNNLDRFLRATGDRTFYYGLLLDRPELVPRLAALFGASKFLSDLFATHPSLIESLFEDPDLLLLPRDGLERDYEEVLGRLRERGRHAEGEVELAALRLFQRRQLVNVGLLDLSGRVQRREAETALTDVAEVCLERALALARDQLARQTPDEAHDDPKFLVVGMGKLGSGELTYGSDLDVIFLYDADESWAAAAQEYFVRLAQKLVWALQVPTAEGSAYSVDAELRPSGNQGMLVTSIDSFRQYHATGAQPWERQALLRARPVAGSDALAATFEEARGAILRQPPPNDLAVEIDRIRRRMETELAREHEGRIDLKTGRGGLVDVEAVVQYLQLQHGANIPELLEPDAIETQLARAESAGLVASASARTLREGWEFLQRLSSRLRIVDNRSISDLDEERGDLESVSRALGYAPSQRTGTAVRGLMDDYRRHTGAIRAVYLEVLGVERTAAPEAVGRSSRTK